MASAGLAARVQTYGPVAEPATPAGRLVVLVDVGVEVGAVGAAVDGTAS
jgi:hypothetical protein